MFQDSPTDLWLALAVVVLASAATGTLTWRIGRKLNKITQIAVVTGLLIATLSYLVWGRDAVFWTRLFPTSGAIILGNPTPWLASALAGLGLAQTALPWWRRGVLALAIVAAGFYVPIQVFFIEPPPTVPTWADGIALQTTRATCSPAAATTLLGQHDIETTEREMSHLCLTSAEGTPLLGLYRGVRLASADHSLKPSMGFMPLDELRQRPRLLPAVVSVQLTAEANERDPRYRERWGWIPGVRHSVTFLEFDGPDHVWVVDPGVGLERWRMDHLRDLWVGDVLSLLPSEE